MDESLTDEERATLKSRAVARLRRQEAELQPQHERSQQRGENLLTSEIDHTFFVEAVGDLRRAGANVPNWYPRRLHLIEHRHGTRGRKMESIDGSALLADIKNVLAIVDPTPE